MGESKPPRGIEHNSGYARKKIELEARRYQVAQMYLRHMSQPDIARLLGITQQTVSHDLKMLRKQWQEEVARSYGDVKGQTLAELDAILRECTQRLSNKERDRSQDSVWITHWRQTLALKAKLLGLLVDSTSIDFASGGKPVTVKEIRIEVGPGEETTAQMKQQ